MKLSIITINFNNLEGLKKTAESVLSQIWRDFEWIIVDGGSTDGSAEYIEQLAACLSGKEAPSSILHLPSSISHLPSSIFRETWHTERFFMPGFTVEDLKKVGNPQPTTLYSQPSLFWCSEPDKGIYNAMNKGIAKARGEYLNFMNSGDCFFELNTLKQVMREDLLDDIIYGDACQTLSDSVRNFKSPERLSLFHLYESVLPHQSAFIRRDLLSNGGYDEKYHIVSDWKQWILWLLEGRSYKHLSLAVSLVDGMGISNTSPTMLQAERDDVIRSIVPQYLIKDMETLSQHKKISTYYPEINEIFHYLQKRRLFRRIVNQMLKFFYFIDVVF